MTADKDEDDQAKSLIQHNTSGPNYGKIVQTGSLTGDIHFHHHTSAWTDVPDPPEIVPPYHSERLAALGQALDYMSPGQVWAVSGFAAQVLVLLWVHDNKKRIPNPLFIDARKRTPQYVADTVQTQQPTHIIFENADDAGQVEPLLEYTAGSRVIIVRNETLPGLENRPDIYCYEIPDNDICTQFPLLPTAAQYDGEIKETSFAAGLFFALITVIVALATHLATWTTVLIGIGSFLLLFCGSWTVQVIRRSVSPPIGGVLEIGREGLRVQRTWEAQGKLVPWENIAYTGIAWLKLDWRFLESTEFSADFMSEAEPLRRWVLYYKDATWETIDGKPDNFLTDEARHASLYGLCVSQQGISYSDFLMTSTDPTEIANALERYAVCNRFYRVPEIRQYDYYIPAEAI